MHPIKMDGMESFVATFFYDSSWKGPALLAPSIYGRFQGFHGIMPISRSRIRCAKFSMKKNRVRHDALL